MRETSNIGTFNASGCERSARGLWQRSGAVLGAVVVLVMAFTGPAVANSIFIPAPGPGEIEVSWTVSNDSGLDAVNAIVYTVTVDDCSRTPNDSAPIGIDATSQRDKWVKLVVNCPSAGSGPDRFESAGLALGSTTTSPTSAPKSAEATFQLTGIEPVVFARIGFVPTADEVESISFAILTTPATSGGGGGGSVPPAPDPRAATVGVAAEQAAAAGVEGSANGVRVRGSEVLPVTSRLLGAIGPRGGVALSSDGLEVRVASVLGARADAGVLVPTNGVFEASVTGPLLPGSVIEVWINSTPRLVAAAEVPEDGDTAILIPTGTPLDGGEPIEDGEHTLELRMFTADGFEVVATGITIGQVTPTRIPAGEGPVPFGAVLLALLGAAGVVVAGRRLVTAG